MIFGEIGIYRKALSRAAESLKEEKRRKLINQFTEHELEPFVGLVIELVNRRIDDRERRILDQSLDDLTFRDVDDQFTFGRNPQVEHTADYEKKFDRMLRRKYGDFELFFAAVTEATSVIGSQRSWDVEGVNANDVWTTILNLEVKDSWPDPQELEFDDFREQFPEDWAFFKRVIRTYVAYAIGTARKKRKKEKAAAEAKAAGASSTDDEETNSIPDSEGADPQWLFWRVTCILNSPRKDYEREVRQEAFKTYDKLWPSMKDWVRSVLVKNGFAEQDQSEKLAKRLDIAMEYFARHSLDQRLGTWETGFKSRTAHDIAVQFQTPNPAITRLRQAIDKIFNSYFDEEE